MKPEPLCWLPSPGPGDHSGSLVGAPRPVLPLRVWERLSPCWDILQPPGCIHEDTTMLKVAHGSVNVICS